MSYALRKHPHKMLFSLLNTQRDEHLSSVVKKRTRFEKRIKKFKYTEKKNVKRFISK